MTRAVVLAVLMAAGCASTRTTIGRLQQAGEAFRVSSMPGLDARCQAVVRQCPKDRPLESCLPYIACRDFRREIAGGFDDLQKGLDSALSLVDLADDVSKGRLSQAIVTATKLLADIADRVDRFERGQ